VFETVAAYDVDFAIVQSSFFTEKGNFTSSTPNPSYSVDRLDTLARLQDTLLSDKHLDRTVFEMLTGPECVSRYTAAFITSGAGFGVPNVEWRDTHKGSGSLSGLQSCYGLQSGSGNLPLEQYISPGMTFECKLCSYADLQLLTYQRLLEPKDASSQMQSGH
jgi:hypothetical protein